jgi:hypothetical protein
VLLILFKNPLGAVSVERRVEVDVGFKGGVNKLILTLLGFVEGEGEGGVVFFDENVD